MNEYSVRVTHEVGQITLSATAPADRQVVFSAPDADSATAGIQVALNSPFSNGRSSQTAFVVAVSDETRTQSYTVTVTRAAPSVPERSGFDLAADAATTGRLGVDDYVTGRINNGDDVDWYAVELKANRGYTFNMIGGYRWGELTNAAITGLYTADGPVAGRPTRPTRLNCRMDQLYWWYGDYVLCGANTNHWSADSGFWNQRGSMVYYKPLTSGTHYIGVTTLRYWNSGTYNLILRDLDAEFVDLNYPGGIGGRGQLEVGMPAAGFIDYPKVRFGSMGADADYFEVDLVAGRRYRITGTDGKDATGHSTNIKLPRPMGTGTTTTLEFLQIQRVFLVTDNNGSDILTEIPPSWWTDDDAERGFDVGPAGHLAALVPGEAAHQRAGLATQRRGDRRGDGRRVVAVGQRRGRVAAGALHDRDRSGEVRFADDEVAFPVAGLRAVRDVVRAGRLSAGIPPAGWAFGPADAARPTAPAAPRQLRPGARRQAAARVVRVDRSSPRTRSYPPRAGPPRSRAGTSAASHSSTAAASTGSRPAWAFAPVSPSRTPTGTVIVRTLAAAGLLAMHRRITAQPLRRPRRSTDEHPLIQTQPRCWTPPSVLHVLATVIMTVHLQPPMEFADPRILANPAGISGDRQQRIRHTHRDPPVVVDRRPELLHASPWNEHRRLVRPSMALEPQDSHCPADRHLPHQSRPMLLLPAELRRSKLGRLPSHHRRHHRRVTPALLGVELIASSGGTARAARARMNRISAAECSTIACD